MAISYAKQEQLKADFAAAINRASVEDDSNTPDHIPDPDEHAAEEAA